MGRERVAEGVKRTVLEGYVFRDSRDVDSCPINSFDML